MKPIYFWIKERHNPQLGIYYVAEGRMSIKDAKRKESGTLYGENIMHKFDNIEDYNNRINELEKMGYKVR